MKSIAVYCGSRSGNDDSYLLACDQLAELFVEQKITMVYGGGNVGLMGRMADGILSAGGKVVGVIPDKINQMGVAHQSITEMHLVKDMHERKAMMEKLSDAFIALPGGIGTMEELFEIFSWGQLAYHQKPYGLLNVSGYYDTLLKFLDEMVMKGFLSQEHRNSLISAGDVKSLFNSLSEKSTDYQPKRGE